MRTDRFSGQLDRAGGASSIIFAAAMSALGFVCFGGTSAAASQVRGPAVDAATAAAPDAAGTWTRGGDAGLQRQAVSVSLPGVRRPQSAMGSSASGGQAIQVARRPAETIQPRISCVPYVRAVTGMSVAGNGGDWWANAAGVYARGNRPEVGSVVVFHATSAMPMGHVAVVSAVNGPRDVRIDHANWAGPGIRPGSVMRGVQVQDVSDRNDWSMVRVQVGHTPDVFGRAYPISGFIYNRAPRPQDRVIEARARRGSESRAGRVQGEPVRSFEEIAQAFGYEGVVMAMEPIGR